MWNQITYKLENMLLRILMLSENFSFWGGHIKLGGGKWGENGRNLAENCINLKELGQFLKNWGKSKNIFFKICSLGGS